MSDLVLICNYGHSVELRGCGVLPPWVYDGRVERYAPSQLLSLGNVLDPHTDDAPQSDWVSLDDEGRDVLFAQMLHRTVCHLVVVESEAPYDGSDVDVSVPRDDRSSRLEPLLKWYRTFAEMARRHVEFREGDYKHVMILICADELSSEELNDLDSIRSLQHLPLPSQVAPEQEQAATEQETEGRQLLDACYVMLPKLNLDVHDVCHARHVWPIMVSRLLVWLLEGNLDYYAMNKYKTYAWRVFEVSTGASQMELSKVMGEGFRELRKDVLGEDVVASPGDADDDDVEVSAVDRQSRAAPEIEFPAKHAPRRSENGWHEYKPVETLGALADEEDVSKRFKQAAEKFAHERGQDPIHENPASWDDAETTWGNVRKHPKNMRDALHKARIEEGRGSLAEMTEAHNCWQAIHEAEEYRLALTEETHGCAEELSVAQGHFIGLRCRLIMAFAVTLAVGYFAFSVFQNLLRSWFVSALIALCSAGGAALSAIWLHLRERKAGENALDAFVGELGNVDAALAGCHRSRCRAMISAARVWDRIHTQSGSARVRLLLDRLSLMLDRELRSETPGVSSVACEADGQGNPVLARRQRDRSLLLGGTTIFPGGDSGHEMVATDMDRINRKIKECIGAFDKEWRVFCEKHAPGLHGHFPAQHLIPYLRSFRMQFCHHITSEFNRQIVEAIRQDESGLLVRLKQDFDRIFDTQNYHFMSCVLNEQMVHGAYVQRLLVRENFDDLKADGPNVRQSNEYLAGLPAIAYLFEEAPIQLVYDEQENRMRCKYVHET